MSRILNNAWQHKFISKCSIDIVLNKELPKLTIIPNRNKYYHNRHRDPKYRRERTRKIWKIDIPDFDQMRKDDKNLTPDQIRAKLKEKGVAPPSVWNEKELYAACTLSVIDPYKPKDDDKSSSLVDKIKLPFTFGTEKIKKSREVSSIRAYEGEDFSLKSFAEQSTDIYVKAHEALVDKDENKLFDYVTEYCFPKLTAGLNRHTIIWKYLGDVEPPVAVQVKSGDLVSKGNKYTQITVRMHTKQILAVYDRHGRLIHGSPNDVKEVLEYIVFEKYMANEYGLWRIHDKIKPESSKQPLSEQVSKTFVINK